MIGCNSMNRAVIPASPNHNGKAQVVMAKYGIMQLAAIMLNVTHGTRLRIKTVSTLVCWCEFKDHTMSRLERTQFAIDLSMSTFHRRHQTFLSERADNLVQDLIPKPKKPRQCSLFGKYFKAQTDAQWERNFYQHRLLSIRHARRLSG